MGGERGKDWIKGGERAGIGKIEGSSAMAIPFVRVYGGNQVSEL